MGIEAFIHTIRRRATAIRDQLAAQGHLHGVQFLDAILAHLAQGPDKIDVQRLRNDVLGIYRVFLEGKIEQTPPALTPLEQALWRLSEDLEELAYILESERKDKTSYKTKQVPLPAENVQTWVQRLRAILERLREIEYQESFTFEKQLKETNLVWIERMATPYFLNRAIRVLEEAPLNPSRLHGAAHMLRVKYGIQGGPTVWRVKVEEGRKFVQEVLALADELDALAEALEASQGTKLGPTHPSN